MRQVSKLPNITKVISARNPNQMELLGATNSTQSADLILMKYYLRFSTHIYMRLNHHNRFRRSCL